MDHPPQVHCVKLCHLVIRSWITASFAHHQNNGGRTSKSMWSFLSNYEAPVNTHISAISKYWQDNTLEILL